MFCFQSIGFPHVQGLSLESKVQVTDQQSTVYKALSLLQGSVSNILFDVALYVPIFDNPLGMHENRN
jgi:hypothetical protein